MAEQTSANPYHARRWLILSVLVFSLLIVILDSTVLNVALKIIADPKRGLGASQGDLEWALNSYTLVFAGLLITFGMLGDRYGHKRILLFGMVVFGLGSLASAYSGSPGELIAARSLMGLGGASVMPATLAVISHVFDPRERGRAIAIWSGSLGLGVAIGPLVGGVLLEHFWWGSVFLINLPIVVVGLIGMVLLVPESRNTNPARLDPVGVVLSIAGLVALIYGIVQGGDSDAWGAASVWGPILIGLAVLVAFVIWESRVRSPAIDVTLFRVPRFSAAVVSVSLVFLAAMGMFFFITFYLQAVRGESPLIAGLWSAPFAAAQLIFAPRSPYLVKRFGLKAVEATALTVMTLGFVAYLTMTATSPMWVLGVVYFVQGAAMANVVPPSTEAVMSALPREKAGAGSALNNTGRQVGGALGVAILGSVLATTYRNGISPYLAKVPGLTSGARSDIASSISATTGFVEKNQASQPRLVTLLRPASDAFIHAMHITIIGCAAFSALAVVVVMVWMPRRDKRPTPIPTDQNAGVVEGVSA
jgi:EmrB/QacA subfamily drug resistance transporter